MFYSKGDVQLKNLAGIITIIVIVFGGATLAVSVFGEGATAAYVGGALITVALIWVGMNEK